MKHTTFLIVFLIVSTSLSIIVKAQSVPSNNTTGTQTNCTPSNCQAICNPGCDINKRCVLGTMKSCGVCPSASCIDNGILGLPTTTTSGSSSGATGNQSSNGGPDGGMIGGIVGGLVGGGLLLAGALFFLFRHKKQKNHGLPFIVSRSRVDMTSSMAMSNTGSRPRTTIHSPTPITTHSLASLSSYQRQQHHLEQKQQQGRVSNNNSHLRPTSMATTVTTDIDDDDDRSSLSSISQRGSAMVASVVGLAQLQQQQQQQQQQLQASKSAQAFQVTRVKPQIMRVNTVRVMGEETGSATVGSGLSRSGSVRTVLTRDNSISSNLSRSNTAPSRRPFSITPMDLQRTTIYSTSSTISPESSPTTATAFTPSLLPLPPISPKRTSAPILLSATTSESNPFHDRHSVIEDDGDDDDDDDGDNDNDNDDNTTKK